MDYNKIIGANIRYERRLRNLTIEELSEVLGIAPGFLGLIERGQRGTSLKNLTRIADFFSITMDTLITRTFDTLGQDDGKSPLELKRLAARSLVDSLNEYELEYFITCLKSFVKLKNIANEYDF
ncbi:MAG: helix-turn-helix domain-containing protein [Clostridiales bacterium]|nr:helix-turn-helix domain-containing protein [Clostridiales bacterium]MCD8238605.1 helix-turn-helix domain-containing protein [Clostridiales bacterium]